MRQERATRSVRREARRTRGQGGPHDPLYELSTWPFRLAYEGWQSAVDGSYRLGELGTELVRRSAALSFRELERFGADDPPAVEPVVIDIESPPGREVGSGEGERDDIAPTGVPRHSTAPHPTSDPDVVSADAFDAFLATFEPELPSSRHR